MEAGDADYIIVNAQELWIVLTVDLAVGRVRGKFLMVRGRPGEGGRVMGGFTAGKETRGVDFGRVKHPTKSGFVKLSRGSIPSGAQSSIPDSRAKLDSSSPRPHQPQS